MHYYQFNIGDYKSHTEHLTEFEDLAYRRMLDWYYTHEIPLPLDTEEIARVIRMRSHCDCIAVVLREFFERTADGWRNHRADKEIAKTGEKSSKAKASAKARWEKKPSKNNELNDDASAMRTHSEGNANAMLHKTHNTEHKTQDTSKAPRKRSAAIEKPDGVSDQVWSDWNELRKAKRAVVTQTVVEHAKREAEKAGLTLDAFLSIWCARGSQGLEAAWLKPAEKARFGQVSNQQLSFSERDELARRKRWEEMTGRKWPTEPQGVIDVSAKTLELEP